MSGDLVYVVGASGSGKDSIMSYARTRLAHHPRICFAHRYVTRRADAGGENHVALSEAEFDARRNAQLFALSWRSHSLCYGIGIEVHEWLARDLLVVVNGSREYLAEASTRYPALVPVMIDVSADVLRTRLHARGREDATAIELRLQRHDRLRQQPWPGVVVNNDGALDAAGERFVDLLLQKAGPLT